MAKKQEVIYFYAVSPKSAPQPKKKSRKGARIFAAIFALLLIAGTTLAGYFARVDGKWFANGDPTTWRWGGIWTEQEDEGAHNHDVHTLADKLESGIMPLSADPDSTTLKFNSDVYPFTVVTHYQDAQSGADYDETHTITNSNTSVYLYSDWDSAYESYVYVVDIYCGENLHPAYCSIDYHDYYAGSLSNVVVEVQFIHEHTYSWVITTTATTEHAGTESYKCSVCGYVSETRVLPQLREPVELPEDPVREGYTFTGWYFDEQCTQPYDGSPIYEDTALYAGWRLNTYTVTFDSKGGNEIAPQTIDWNTSATLSEPERVGYVFEGWYLEDGTQYEDQPITADVTLTAKWERVKCTVTFYVGGVLYTTLTVDYGTSLIKAAEAAGLFEQNITSYAFINGEEAVGELSEVKVTDDMTVSANEPTEKEKALATVNRYWLPATSCVVDAVALILLGWAIFGGKRR